MIVWVCKVQSMFPYYYPRGRWFESNWGSCLKSPYFTGFFACLDLFEKATLG